MFISKELRKIYEIYYMKKTQIHSPTHTYTQTQTTHPHTQTSRRLQFCSQNLGKSCYKNYTPLFSFFCIWMCVGRGSKVHKLNPSLITSLPSYHEFCKECLSKTAYEW